LLHGAIHHARWRLQPNANTFRAYLPDLIAADALRQITAINARD
jgi:hypothetical protein